MSSTRTPRRVRPALPSSLSSTQRNTQDDPSAATPTSPHSSSSARNTSPRRTSIYGTNDRVVLDIGSRCIKCGFSDEPRPRHVVDIADFNGATLDPKTELGDGFAGNYWNQELYTLDLRKQDIPLLTARLAHILKAVFFQYLCVDPRERKVIICEPSLMPVPFKGALCDVLFRNLQVPSIAFVPSSLSALLTTGRQDGLIIDCGHLETSVSPVYDARPLFPFTTTTPRGGWLLTKRLSQLLSFRADLELSIPTVEDIKTRLLIVRCPKDSDDYDGSGVLLNTSSIDLKDEQAEKECLRSLLEVWKQLAPPADATMSANPMDVQYELNEKWEPRRQMATIPGWIRERSAEVLFSGDGDAAGVAECVLDCLLKIPSADLRVSLASSMLLTGGMAHLPNFAHRLISDLRRAVTSPTSKRYHRYQRLSGLAPTFAFVDGAGKSISHERDPGGPEPVVEASSLKESSMDDRLSRKNGIQDVSETLPPSSPFMPNIRSWIGASLLGAMRSTTTEITRKQYTSSTNSGSSRLDDESLSATLGAAATAALAVTKVPDWTNFLCSSSLRTDLVA